MASGEQEYGDRWRLVAQMSRFSPANYDVLNHADPMCVSRVETQCRRRMANARA